jgi:hypothetical protein
LLIRATCKVSLPVAFFIPIYANDRGIEPAGRTAERRKGCPRMIFRVIFYVPTLQHLATLALCC